MKAQGLKVNFKTSAVNAKGERVFNMVIKGELADAQILALDKLKASSACFMDLYSAQAEMDDYDHDDETNEEPHKGMAYSVDKDGTAQLTIDEISDKHYQEKVLDYDHAFGDGEPSDDEKEIESMESEVSQEEREAAGLPFEPKKDELNDELW